MSDKIVINENRPIEVPEKPIQFDTPQLTVADVEVDSLIRVNRARDTFRVNGTGLTVAVLDTGLRTTHVDFAGKVVAQKNFTQDNGGNGNDASDGNGHGTNVAGIIVADADHTGIAPKANVIPLKVLTNNGNGNFAAVKDALQWVLDNHRTYNISVVNMSLGDSGNYNDDAVFNDDATRNVIARLKANNVIVVAAAGNDYFRFRSPGMGFPSILRDTISVGAVYDANVGSFSYASGATANTTGRDRITPFSQRLHLDHNQTAMTDIFAPGAPVTSSGINNDHGESIQHGTSQATPVTAGVILLMQDFYKQNTGRLPSLSFISQCLQNGGVPITDGDDEDDNVPHSNKRYSRIDALLALDAVRRSLQIELLTTQAAYR
jgi:subtilisin family serine protease